MGPILIVDDDPSIRKVMAVYMKQAQFSVIVAASAEEALTIFNNNNIELVIMDLRLGEGVDGLELIQEFKVRKSRMPVIMITAYGTTDVAVQAMKEGAYDFITKPFDFAELLKTVKNALMDIVPLHATADDTAKTAVPALHFNSFIGESPEMLRLYTLINKIAPTDASVLITGESGTGKELAARAIHSRSARKEEPWVPINCGAIPSELLEAELFGYVAGAFTGADGARQGLFQEAHNGTLFLDEIGIMEYGLQRKLLRVLQEGSVRPLGQNEDVRIDVRIIGATNEDIDTKITTGEFRKDLYYRLNVIPLEMPPLRRRRQDIPLLARHFCAELSRKTDREIHLTDEALEALKNYGWPGNIRELQNAVLCAGTLTDDNMIRLDDLPPNIVGVGVDQKYNSGEDVIYKGIEEGKTLRQFLQEKERDYMEAVLRHTKGNRAKTADLLGISRATLYRKYPGN